MSFASLHEQLKIDCQAPPKLQDKLSLKSELVLFSLDPVTHPGKYLAQPQPNFKFSLKGATQASYMEHNFTFSTNGRNLEMEDALKLLMQGRQSNSFISLAPT